MLISKTKMTTNISYREKPWQNSVVGSRNKLKTLFNDGHFTDLTITFPGKEISYKAHKVILAMSSSIFEGMLFGPMAIAGSELELPDDNPEAFKIILAHCYEVTTAPPAIDLALEVYMLADKYFLEQLREEYTYYIGNMLNSDTIYKIIYFASNFSFDSLKLACYEHFGSRFECDIADSSKALLVLHQEWLRELLESGISIRKLIFEDSWKHPDETLCEETIIQILKSKHCRNQSLRKFSGCVSARVVNNICKAAFEDEGSKCTRMYLSFTNLQQANEIISILETVKCPVWIYIHLQCKVIPADRLRPLPTTSYPFENNEPDLFLSNVDDGGIEWVVSAISSLMPQDGSFDVISFPRSKLTFSGLKTLLAKLTIVFKDVANPDLLFCSLEIPSSKEFELDEWIESNSILIGGSAVIKLFDRNEDIDGWQQQNL